MLPANPRTSPRRQQACHLARGVARMLRCQAKKSVSWLARVSNASLGGATAVAVSQVPTSAHMCLTLELLGRKRAKQPDSSSATG